jgi:hypothetical protein
LAAEVEHKSTADYEELLKDKEEIDSLRSSTPNIAGVFITPKLQTGRPC